MVILWSLGTGLVCILVVTSFTNANRLGQAIALVPEVGVGMDNGIEGGYVGRISQAVAFLCS